MGFSCREHYPVFAAFLQFLMYAGMVLYIFLNFLQTPPSVISTFDQMPNFPLVFEVTPNSTVDFGSCTFHQKLPGNCTVLRNTHGVDVYTCWLPFHKSSCILFQNYFPHPHNQTHILPWVIFPHGIDRKGTYRLGWNYYDLEINGHELETRGPTGSTTQMTYSPNFYFVVPCTAEYQQMCPHALPGSPAAYVEIMLGTRLLSVTTPVTFNVSIAFFSSLTMLFFLNLVFALTNSGRESKALKPITEAMAEEARIALEEESSLASSLTIRSERETLSEKSEKDALINSQHNDNL